MGPEQDHDTGPKPGTAAPGLLACGLASARARLLLGPAFALALGGCVSGNPASDQSPTTQAAPADLQLLCANAAATQTGTGADDVRPVNSRKIGSYFQVELKAGSRTMSCIVDANGAVKSVQQTG